VERVELSAKCNFVFVGSGDGDAVLLAIDYYFTTIIAGPGILVRPMGWNVYLMWDRTFSDVTD
jgi:hypothetical protein